MAHQRPWHGVSLVVCANVERRSSITNAARWSASESGRATNRSLTGRHPNLKVGHKLEAEQCCGGSCVDLNIKSQFIKGMKHFISADSRRTMTCWGADSAKHKECRRVVRLDSDVTDVPACRVVEGADARTLKEKQKKKWWPLICAEKFGQKRSSSDNKSENLHKQEVNNLRKYVVDPAAGCKNRVTGTKAAKNLLCGGQSRRLHATSLRKEAGTKASSSLRVVGGRRVQGADGSVRMAAQSAAWGGRRAGTKIGALWPRRLDEVLTLSNQAQFVSVTSG